MNQKTDLKNNHHVIVKRTWIVAGISFILMLLPLQEWSPISSFFGLSLISLFIFMTSIVVVFIYKSREKKLQSLITGENLLAEWILTDEEKENYINYLYKNEKNKNKGILFVIAVMSTIIFGIFILVIDEGKIFMLGVYAGLLIIMSLFAFGMPVYYRNSNRNGDGKILIGAKYAYINGYFHNWDYLFSGLSKVKIMKKPFYGINLVYYYTDRTLLHSEELYIPANEEIDLEELVKSLKALNDKK